MELTPDATVMWACTRCDNTGIARADTHIHCTCGVVSLSDRERTPTTWPEHATPTALQLAEWLENCTEHERIFFALDEVRARGDYIGN